MSEEYVKQRIAGADPESQVKRLERELQEYVRVEGLLVECKVVTRERLDQAHQIIRELTP